MKRIVLTIGLAVSLAFPALAQAIIQSGPVVPGHVPVWIQNGQVSDAGVSNNGFITALGLTASGTPFCINDGPISAPYHQFCMGANSLGGGLISYNAFNGATALPLQFNVNGVLATPLEGTPSGNTSVFATVVKPTTATDLAVWDTHGNLIDGGPVNAGIINPGIGGNLTWYPTSGTTLSGNPDANISSGILTLGIVNAAQGGVIIEGATSGGLELVTQSIAGTPVWTAGTASGTPAVTATAPLAIASTTGNLTCATCVAAPSALTSNQLVVGLGMQQAQVLGSAGTTTTVLHGNAAGLPSFGAVALATDVSGQLPFTNGGTGLASGTSGGILAFTGSTTLVSSGALTANMPVIGGGAGIAPTVGSVTGNTTIFGTSSGALVNGDCVSINAGNFVDAGGPCTTGGGGGTVASSTIGQMPVYTAATVVTGSANANLSSGTLTLGHASSVQGSLVEEGSSSGALTITTQASAGTPTWTAGTSSGTPVVTASAPLSITTATGNITCANCGTTWNDTPKTTSFSASANNGYCVDTLTTGAVSATLPTTPTGGTKVQLIDCKHNFGTTAMTVVPGGSDDIMGIASSMIDNTTNGNITLIYDATTADWYVGG